MTEIAPTFCIADVKDHLFDTFGHKENNPVSLLKTHFDQSIGHAVRNLFKGAVVNPVLRPSFPYKKDSLLLSQSKSCFVEQIGQCFEHVLSSSPISNPGFFFPHPKDTALNNKTGSLCQT